MDVSVANGILIVEIFQVLSQICNFYEGFAANLLPSQFVISTKALLQDLLPFQSVISMKASMQILLPLIIDRVGISNK